MPSSDPDRLYLVALSHFPKFGPARLKKLKAAFPDWRTAFGASAAQLQLAGIDPGTAVEFVAARTAIDPEALAIMLAQEGITTIALGDSDYPQRLAALFDPPMILYVRGTLVADEYAVAIVGTRKASRYGRQVAETFAAGLAAHGICVVSGLALGIDAFAHTATLDSGGRTIGVLGTGIDRASIYPSSNRFLADRIAQNGAIITEFPLGTPPLPHHFPQRNRIIAGLSAGTVVIEAGERSGALITASSALENGREVMAVPGNIFSDLSRGPHRLLSQGARVVTSVEDILSALDLQHVTAYIENKSTLPATADESAINAALSFEPLHVDEIIRAAALPAATVNAALTLMEMKGQVRNLGGMKYVKTK